MSRLNPRRDGAQRFGYGQQRWLPLANQSGAPNTNVTVMGDVVKSYAR